MTHRFLHPLPPPVSCIQAKAKYSSREVFKLNRKKLYIALCLLVAFVLWTAAICLIDVQPIGPQGSAVGFATLNGLIHRLIGVHMALYTVTDWLGLVPIAFVLGFALLGLVQLIKRKHLLKVDRNILVLGVFYLVMLAVFFLFEVFVVNYRPVLIEGQLEASYPSSTTMLVMCVMPTAMMQLHTRIKNSALRISTLCMITAFTAFMVIGRLISGVHWFTDIVGGALLSAGLVLLYDFICNLVD